MPIVPMARAIAAAIGTPSMPQRVDSDPSATMTTLAVLGCSKSLTTIGLKLVSVDCGQSTADSRSPACQSRSPTKSNPVPWKTLRCSPMVNSRIRRRMSSSISVSSERFTNGSTSVSRVRIRVVSSKCNHEDTKTTKTRSKKPKSFFFVTSCLCLRAFVIAFVSCFSRSRDCDAFDHVVDDDVRGEAVAGRVRAEPDAVAQDVRREILNVLRVHLRSLPDQQRPDFREPSPADDRARGRTEVDAVLDQLRRRVSVPVGFGVVRTRGGDQALDVPREPLVQEHLLVDGAAQLDDPLLGHQGVQLHFFEVEMH